jgi:nucleotide-binding universal stress UspA family protein
MPDMTVHAPVIAVGVDGSPASIAGLRWARQYAQATGGTVRAVRAWHYPAAFGTPTGVAPEPVTSEARQLVADELAAAIAEASGDPAAPLEPRLGYGHAAEVLVAESQDADLLVVGRSGRGAFAAMMLGSVSLHCVASAACPVVVVGESTSNS